MHRHSVLYSAVFAAIVFQGCNCTGREFELRRTFNVHSAATDALCSTEKQTVSLGEDQSFNDVKAFIGRVELRKLRVEVKNEKTRDDSIVTKAGGKVNVAANDTDAALTLGTYADVEIKNGNGQDIQFDQAAANRLGELALKSPNSFQIAAEGCNDKVPAFYDFDVILTVFAGL